MKKSKNNFHPGNFKKIIEMLELIPSEKFGVVFSQDNMGFPLLYFYREAYENMGEKIIEDLVSVFINFECNVTIKEFKEEFCGPHSGKREILDYMNIRYLMLNGRRELRELINSSELIFGNSGEMLGYEYVSTASKAVLLKNISFKQYAFMTFFENDKKLRAELISKILKRDRKQEYDYTLAIRFRKNFKSAKFHDIKTQG